MSTKTKHQIKLLPGETVLIDNGATLSVSRRATLTIRDYSGPLIYGNADVSLRPDVREPAPNEPDRRGKLPHQNRKNVAWPGPR